MLSFESLTLLTANQTKQSFSPNKAIFEVTCLIDILLVRSTFSRIAVLASSQKEGKNTSSDIDRQILGHIMNAKHCNRERRGGGRGEEKEGEG